MGIKFEVKLYKDRAGPPSPSLDPAALSTRRRRPPSSGPDDDDDDWPEDDGTDLDAVQEDEDELPDDEKFYIPLFMSGQKKNLPHDIVRHDSVPLNKNEYFSLWKNWNQLLAGKRTYLRPLRDRRVLSASGVFLRPLARPWTLEFQEPLLDLVQDYPDNDIVQEMIKILCQRYVDLRRTRGDGSCFYRAFFFSYLENLGQMQDSQAEVTRLMEHVAVSRENFCRLKWDKAYFLNSEEYFSSVASYGCCSAQAFTTKIVDIRSSRHDILLRCLFVAPLRVLYAELNHLVNSVANGLSSDELYKRSRQEIMPLRIISLLRLLAETEIRTGIDDYKPFIPGKMNVNQYCWKEVRPLDVKASALAVRALTYALGIPVRLETLGQGLTAGGLQVKCLDFFPRSESGKGAFHIVQSYWSSATTPEPLELGSGNLLSSDGTPLLTLLCRPDNCDILYRK